MPDPAQTLKFILTTRDWIHAQRNEFSWERGNSLTRQIQIDFSLRPLQEEVGGQSSIYLPIAEISKEFAPRVLSVFDESGRRVPTLTATESMQHAALMLLSSFPDEEKATDELTVLLAGLTTQDPRRALLVLEQLKSASAPHLLDGQMRLLVESLAWSFPLIVEVPVTDAARQSLSLEMTLPMTSVGGIRREIVRRLGWTASSLLVDLGAVGSMATLDVVVRAPEQVSLSQAELLLTDQPSDNEGPETGGFNGPGRISTISLGVSHPPPNAKGLLCIGFVPNRSYTLGVLAAAILVAAVLSIGSQHLKTITDSSDASTSILLAGPGLFSAFVAQPGRGSFSARLVTGARAILLLSSLLAFLAAGTLVAMSSISEMERAWTALTAVAWLNVAILLVGVASPGARRSARRSTQHRPRKARFRVALE